MGRKPCGPAADLRRGAWTAEEDRILQAYIKTHGEGRWRALPKKAGLKRCGKSCRLRWLNYLRPDIKRGNITSEEEDLIIRLHRLIGNRWSLIAGRLPGRTDNEIKNYWNTYLRKKAECAREGGGLGESREQDFFAEQQLGDSKSETGHDLASGEAVRAPGEDSWWDVLVGLDAARSPSWFNFAALCEDASPRDEGFRNWTNRSTTTTTASDLELELEAVADFLDWEG